MEKLPKFLKTVYNVRFQRRIRIKRLTRIKIIVNWRRRFRLPWNARSNQSILNPKILNQPWIFISRTDAEVPILWLPDARNWFIKKDGDVGKDWGQETVATEDKMIGWHHQFNWPELKQTPGDSEGQGSLACCSPWGCRVGPDFNHWTATTTMLHRSLEMERRLFWVTEKSARITFTPEIAK